MFAPRFPSHKVAVQPYSLPPTPPLSYAESLDDDFPVFEASIPSSLTSSRASHFTVPPPGALVYEQRVHRPPKKLTRRERARLRYGGLLFDWETLVVHALFLALLLVAYLALSRLVAPAHLARLGARATWYLTGGGTSASGLVARP
ncbi:hypothetical protein JCM3775_004079 [Rhodotorula graminis]